MYGVDENVWDVFYVGVFGFFFKIIIVVDFVYVVCFVVVGIEFVVLEMIRCLVW